MNSKCKQKDSFAIIFQATESRHAGDEDGTHSIASAGSSRLEGDGSAKETLRCEALRHDCQLVQRNVQ